MLIVDDWDGEALPSPSKPNFSDRRDEGSVYGPKRSSLARGLEATRGCLGLGESIPTGAVTSLLRRPCRTDFGLRVINLSMSPPPLVLHRRWEVLGVDGALKLLDSVLDGLGDSKVTAAVIIDVNLTNGDMLEAIV